MDFAVTVTPIKSYSIYHLLVCLGAAILAAAVVCLLKKLKKTGVIAGIGIILALIEVAKQVIMHFIYPSYSWSDIPFQLCSIPMYMCLLYPFAKKFRRAIEIFLRSFGLLGGIVAFAIPYDVFNKYLMLSVQSIIWHQLLLILGVYCIVTAGAQVSARTSAQPADYRTNAFIYLALAITAICINALLKNVSAGTSNMFFLGPSRPYTIILDDIYENCGWVTASLAMIIVSEIAGAIVLFAGSLPHILKIRFSGIER